VVVSRRRDAQDTFVRALAILSLPLVVLGFGAYWLATQMAGCEFFALDFGPRDLGLRPGPRGTVVVDPGPCAPVYGRELILRGPQSQVLWRAVGPAGFGDTLAPFTVGRAPAGFHDVVPLAFPLLPRASYTVEVRALDAGGGTAGSTALPFGGQGAFRPGDLAPGRVWFAGRSLTPAEFARQACATGTTTATTS
jgi:hypothetical protein